MASIKCPGCGREISSFADNCNYCGHQISAERQNPSTAGNERKKFDSVKFVAIAIVIVLVVLSFIGRVREEQARQEQRMHQIDISAPDFEDVFVPKESTDN